MKTQPTSRPGYHPTNVRSMTRIVALVALVALIGIPLFSTSSASFSNERLEVGTASPATVVGVSDRRLSKRESGRSSDQLLKSIFPPSTPIWPVLPQSTESIATFEFPGCTVPKDSFDLGETVCAIVTGAPLGTVDRAARRIAWVSPRGSLTQAAERTSDPQTDSYV